MAFTIADFTDLVRLLSEHPEWRVQLRPLILGEQILEVPSRMDRVEATLDRVADRLDQLGERMDQLTARVDQLGERMDQLTARVDQLTASVQALVERQDRYEGDLGNIRGELLESRFERNLGNWLREWARRPRKVQIDDLALLDEALAAGRVTEDEVRQLAALDFLVQAQDRDTAREVLFAVEVSQTVPSEDVERASSRAAILCKAGYNARGLVTGHRLSRDAEELVERLGTAVALVRPAA